MMCVDLCLSQNEAEFRVRSKSAFRTPQTPHCDTSRRGANALRIEQLSAAALVVIVGTHMVMILGRTWYQKLFRNALQ